MQLKTVGYWSLCFLSLCLSTASPQSQPVWDSGNVKPATHDRSVPQLRVEKNWWEYTLYYRVLPNGAEVKDARIEVWDGPVLVFRQAVTVNAAEGKLVWQNSLDRPPNKLEIALLDPDFKPSRICFDDCIPEDLNRLLPTSELVVGVGPDGDPPYPQLQVQGVRTAAGAPRLEAVLAGLYLAPDSRLLLAEYDPENRTYKHLQLLPFEYIDLYHVKVALPAFLLQTPRILVLNALPPLDDHRVADPVFDGTWQQSMPGTSGDYSVSIVVACPESPYIDRLKPDAVRADATEIRNLSVETTESQDSPPEQGTYLHLLGKNFNGDSRVMLGPDPVQGQVFETEFISPTELRFWVESERLKAYVGYTVTAWVVNQKQHCAISNEKMLQVLPTDEIKEPVPGGQIMITEPYPMPLMKPNGPQEMELIIHGKNFRRNVRVVASIDDAETKDLKTTFISSEELRALLPGKLWRIHTPSFRFVIKAAAGEQAVEIAEPEH